MIISKLNQLTKHKSLQNLSIYGFGQAFNLLTPILIIPYIISVCGLENYGKTATAMAIIFFLMVFVDYGCDISGVKAISVNRDDKNKLREIVTTTYGAKFLLLTLVLTLVTALVLVIPYLRQESDLYLLSLPILVGQFLNPTWFLQGVENFKQITTINILSKLLYVIGIFQFVNTANDYILVNLCWGIGMIIANGISVFLIFKSLKVEFSHFRFSMVKKHIKSEFSIFSSQIFVSIQLYSPLILVGFFGGATLAGIYRVVDQVIVIFKTYLLLFFNFMFPRVCYLLGNNVKSGVKFWMMYNSLNFVFILFAMFIIHVYATEIVQYFSPDAYEGLAELLQIGVYIPIVMALSIPLKQLVLGLNHNRYYVNTIVTFAIFNFAVIILLIGKYGVQGVLWSLITTEALMVIILYLKINKTLFLPQK